MVKILLVRHGETNYNLQGLCNSSGPEVFLTAKGISQATELKNILELEKIDQVIVSPTFRTKETLKYLNLNLPTTEDPRISELKTGYEGRPISEYLKLIPDSIKDKLPQGESVEDLHLRVLDFINELKKHNNKTVLVISHSLVIKVIRVICENLPLSEVNNLDLPKNGEVISIIF